MSLCNSCASITIGNGGRGSFGTEVILGPYTDLESRASTCEGCKFFVEIIKSSLSWRDRIGELGGMGVVFTRGRLDVRNLKRMDRGGWMCDDLLFDVCVEEGALGNQELDVDREEVDEKRVIAVNAMEEKAISQIRTWISDCENHKSCSTPRIGKLPKRIIEIPSNDTEAPRVCLSDGKMGEYVVLSHCPGGVESLAIRQFPADLDVESLPKTLKDAMAITRRLGYRYLWAASLCVIQDDKSDWDEELSKFGAIFGQAALMISATEGKDSNSGMLHDRHILYSPALGANKDRYLRLHLLRWKWDLERSPLGNHGWAAIEQMLAPRILHFAKHQMIWECAEGHKFEASGILDLKYGSGQIRQTYQKKSVQPYVEKTLCNYPIELEVVGSEAEIAMDVGRLEAWLTCVEEFAKRSLKDPEDKLRAMAPIANIFDNGNLGQYISGMWSKHIAFNLAWGRVYSLLTPAPHYRAPSWSWASVDGPTSALGTSWPETMMQEHARDRIWLDKYEPKLESLHTVLADPDLPYGGVLQGSYIVVSGMCIGFMKLAVSLKDGGNFYMNCAMDQSQVFDCSCCIPRSDEVQQEASENFNSEADHHFCMIMMGDAWRQGKELERGFCDLLILKACEEGGTYKRVGFVSIHVSTRFALENMNAEIHDTWDGLGWERRALKLI